MSSKIDYVASISLSIMTLQDMHLKLAKMIRKIFILFVVPQSKECVWHHKTELRKNIHGLIWEQLCIEA